MAYKEKKTSSLSRLLFSILLIALGIWSLYIYFTSGDRVLLIPGIVLAFVGIMMLVNTISKRY